MNSIPIPPYHGMKSQIPYHTIPYHLTSYPVLITPPPIPTGLQESSRIPTGFLLDSNKISKKAFSHIFSFPPTGLLLDSYWIPAGLLLDSYWTPTELKQISQTECNGSDTGFLLESYWSIIQFIITNT